MTYNFRDHKKGDTFNGVIFTITVNSVPLNLTGATIRMALKSKGVKVAVKVLSTTDHTITIVTPLEGRFRIEKQIIDVPANIYLYDIQLTLSDGTVKTYVEGTWKILQDVTD